MDLVDECDSVDYVQGNDETFINKLLDEMKIQFNKPEVKIEVEENVSDESVDIQSLSSRKEEMNKNNDENEMDECDSSELPLVFKKPQQDSPSKVDVSTSGKKIPRQKKNELDVKIEESTVKRSSRRTSRDHKESILQSAIARKEKSYNESNKPQRLTRQLKPTLKILENLASVKQEKSKIKYLKNTDKSIDFEGQSTTDDSGCVDVNNKRTKEMLKIPRKVLKSQKLIIMIPQMIQILMKVCQIMMMYQWNYIKSKMQGGPKESL